MKIHFPNLQYNLSIKKKKRKKEKTSETSNCKKSRNKQKINSIIKENDKV